MDRDISVRSTKTSGPVKVDHLCGPPSKGVPNIPVGPNRNGPFHLISNRNFRDFELNRKRPVYPEVKGKKRGYSKGSHSPSLACYRLPPKSQGRLKNVVAADNAKFMSMGWWNGHDQTIQTLALWEQVLWNTSQRINRLTSCVWPPTTENVLHNCQEFSQPLEKCFVKIFQVSADEGMGK